MQKEKSRLRRALMQLQDRMRQMRRSRSWHGTLRWEQFQRIKEQFLLLRPNLHSSYRKLQAIAIL